MRLKEELWSITFPFVFLVLAFAEKISSENIEKRYTGYKNKASKPSSFTYSDTDSALNTHFNAEAEKHSEYFFQLKLSIMTLLFLCYSIDKYGIPEPLQKRIDAGHRSSKRMAASIGHTFFEYLQQETLTDLKRTARQLNKQKKMPARICTELVVESAVDTLTKQYDALRTNIFSSLPRKSAKDIYKETSHTVVEYLLALPSSSSSLDQQRSHKQ